MLNGSVDTIAHARALSCQQDPFAVGVQHKLASAGQAAARAPRDTVILKDLVVWTAVLLSYMLDLPECLTNDPAAFDLVLC